MKNHTARCILLSAIALGVLGDILLNGQRLGINLLLLLVAGLATTEMISWDSNVPFRRQAHVLMWVSVVFAIAICCRTSVTLTALNFEAITTIFVLSALRGRNGEFLDIDVMEYSLYHFIVALETLLGCIGTVKDNTRPPLPGVPAKKASNVLVIIRGVAMATPLILVFGALFCSADAMFANIISRLFHWNFALIWSNIWVSTLLACFAAGALRTLIVWRQVELPIERQTFFSIGAGEIIVVLSLMNALFLAFVMVQFRYLFGSHNEVNVTPGLSYAQYARGGFFELVAVTLLVLPTLLGLDWFYKKDSNVNILLFRSLTLGLVLQLFVIMLSALHRMQLYVAEFSLTELRLYSTAFIIWLGLVFVWFLMTVLVGSRQKFIFGALMSALVVVFTLDLINPDAVIVHYNCTMEQAPGSFDMSYLEGLSADSIPELMTYFVKLPNGQRKQDLRACFKSKYPHEANTDWRSWNRSQYTAVRLVEERVK